MRLGAFLTGGGGDGGEKRRRLACGCLCSCFFLIQLLGCWKLCAPDQIEPPVHHHRRRHSTYMEQSGPALIRRIDIQLRACRSGHLRLLDTGATYGIPVLQFRPHIRSDATGSILIVAGEHVRERITTEIAFALLAGLCNGGGGGAASIVTIVPRLNEPFATANDCTRKNANGVDLNRNYPYRFEEASSDAAAPDYRGPGPLSEAESKLVYGLLDRLRPTQYVSLHSGEFAAYVPWDSEREPDHARLRGGSRATLNCVQRLCPRCATGSAGALSSYLAFGTASDTAVAVFYVPRVFTLEVYGNETAAATGDCFAMFNPETGERFTQLVDQWVGIFDSCLF
jgi:hypothetical protein